MVTFALCIMIGLAWECNFHGPAIGLFALAVLDRLDRIAEQIKYKGHARDEMRGGRERLGSTTSSRQGWCRRHDAVSVRRRPKELANGHLGTCARIRSRAIHGARQG